MDTRTVQDVVKQWLQMKKLSYQQYINNVNQFLNILDDNDWENIRQYYPGKDLAFFRAVLEELGEL